MKAKYPQIVYFDTEGRDNLPDVIRVVKKAVSKREELRAAKLVVFTAEGEGAYMAYRHLAKFDTQIIAVTFPLSFSARQPDGTVRTPRIAPKLKKFFDGVGVTVVIPPTLPFDSISGMDSLNEAMNLIKNTITLFGGGFTMCIQAVLRACDAGVIEEGERVIAMAGDCAAIVTAAYTGTFLTKRGIAVHEILCKARNLTIARPTLPAPPQMSLYDKVIEASIESPTRPDMKTLTEGQKNP